MGPVVGRLMSESRFRRSFAALFGPESKPDTGELHDFWSLITHNDGKRVMHKLIHYMSERVQHGDRWSAALAESRIPLRLINGSDDPVSGRHMGEAYERLVPEPDVVYLDGIGHYPQVEAPESTLLAYWDFIIRLKAAE